MALEAKDIKKNKWYMIENYGFSTGIKGKAVDICCEYVTLKFYWGSPFRSRQVVKLNRLVGECEPPSLFSNH
jgi:hypothetical protein